MSRPRRRPRDVVALAAEAASVWLRHALPGPLKPRLGLPRAMVFISTHRCTARCIMCGIWQESGDAASELSLDELRRIVADRLFSAVEFVSINGGEPFLRDDLAEVCDVLLAAGRRVKRLSLTTSGLHTRRMSEVLPDVAARAQAAGALLDVSISVHGLGDLLDRIYGVAGAAVRIERSLELVERLRDEGRLSVSLNCVLLPENLSGADELRQWAAGRGVPISFVVGERRSRFRTGESGGVVVDGDDLAAVIAFMRRLADDPSQPAATADKYREIAAMLETGSDRTLACTYAMGGVLLGHDGRLYYCPHSRDIGNCLERPPFDIYFDPRNLDLRRRELLDAECLRCPPYTRTRREISKDLPRVVAAAVRQRLRRHRSGS